MHTPNRELISLINAAFGRLPTELVCYLCVFLLFQASRCFVVFLLSFFRSSLTYKNQMKAINTLNAMNREHTLHRGRRRFDVDRADARDATLGSLVDAHCLLGLREHK